MWKGVWEVVRLMDCSKCGLSWWCFGKVSSGCCSKIVVQGGKLWWIRDCEAAGALKVQWYYISSETILIERQSYWEFVVDWGSKVQVSPLLLSVLGYSPTRIPGRLIHSLFLNAPDNLLHFHFALKWYQYEKGFTLSKNCVGGMVLWKKLCGTLKSLPTKTLPRQLEHLRGSLERH